MLPLVVSMRLFGAATVVSAGKELLAAWREPCWLMACPVCRLFARPLPTVAMEGKTELGSADAGRLLAASDAFACGSRAFSDACVAICGLATRGAVDGSSSARLADRASCVSAPRARA